MFLSNYITRCHCKTWLIEDQIVEFRAAYIHNIHNIQKLIFYCVHFSTPTFMGKVSKPSISEIFISSILAIKKIKTFSLCVCL